MDLTSGATFSEDGRFRFRLWRRWADDAPSGGDVCFIMLNPSTADEVSNDPTVERCQRRAQRLGYGGLQVVNIFALRSTDPAGLYEDGADIGDGQENNRAICDAVAASDLVIAAWGRHGHYRRRDRAIRELLWVRGTHVFCLGTNRDGTPKHPLYLRNDCPLVPLECFPSR